MTFAPLSVRFVPFRKLARLGWLGMLLAGLLGGLAGAQVTNPAGYSFGTVALGSSGSTTVTFAFTGSVTVASVSVVTQGTTGLDFQATSADTSTTLCTAKAYTNGQSCTVDITFAPLVPGKRSGAAILRNSSNVIVGTAYFTGIGSGAQLGFAGPSVSTFAGMGIYSTTASAAGSTGTSASFVEPEQIAFDGAGNMYMADLYAEQIYKITPAGLVSVVLGKFKTNCGTVYTCGYPTSNSTTLGTSVEINSTYALTVDGAGQLWFADGSVGNLATIDLATDFVTAQVVGSGTLVSPVPVTSGNIHSCAAQCLGFISSVTTDGLGNVYVSDVYDGTQTTAYGQIVKIDAAGNISLVAGTAVGYYGSSAPADGATATSSSVSEAYGMGFDGAGNLYYLDEARYIIYRIDTSGKVHPFAGTGSSAVQSTAGIPYWLSGTASTTANTAINVPAVTGFGTQPSFLAVDSTGNVYYPSQNSGTTLVFTPSGYAYVLAGNGTLGNTDGPVSSALLAYPIAVALNGTGDIYISEFYGKNASNAYVGSSVRKWSVGASTLSFGTQAKGSTSAGQTVTATNIGNAALVLTTPGTGVTNPSAASGFTLLANSATNACATGNSGAVAVGSSCSVITAFQPHVSTGTVTGNLTFAGNISSAASTVPLSGTATSGVASLTMTGLPTTTASGATNTVTVSAYDSSQNLFTGYTGTVHFSVSPSDVAAVLSSDYSFTGSEGGTKTFSAALSAVGLHTVTVADTANSLSANESTTVASPIDHFAFTTIPTIATAGTSFNVTVTAYSNSGTTVATNYTGPVTFTSTDGNAVFPTGTSLNMTAGVGTYSITLKTAGTKTITVADSSGSPSLASGNIVVSAGALSSLLTVSGSGQSASINTAFTNPLVVEALDAYSNSISGVSVAFAGPVSGASATITGSPAVTAATTGLAQVTATANGTGGGPYNVTASSGLVSTTYALTNVVPLTFTVNSIVDPAAGNAANCATPNNNTCTLRDALAAAAANTTSPSIVTFVANTPYSIVAGQSGFTIPTNTTIQGTTSGSGASLTNLVTVSGNNLYTVFTVASGSTATISNLSVMNGKATTNIGSGQMGGGDIYNAGTLTINTSAISGGSANYGGNLYSTGPVTINNSTITGSTGNALLNGGGIWASGALTITGSTISGNNAGSNGSGVYCTAACTLTDSTLSANTGAYAAFFSQLTPTLNNSIVEGNMPGSTIDIYAGTSGTSVSGSGSVYNVTSTAVSPSLAPLANYGGPTLTMLPLPGSKAICTQNNTAIAGVTGTDQRGYPRTTSYNRGAYVCLDAGAVESNYGLEFVQQPTNTNVNATITPSPTVQLTENNVPISLAGEPIAITSVSFTLQGTLTQSTGSTGLATFPGLSLNTATTYQSLQANIQLVIVPNVAVLGANAQSSTFNVVIPVDHYVWTGLPATAVAGVPFTGTITAYADAAGLNVATGYNGQLSFTASLGNVVLPQSVSMVNGVASNLSFTLKSAGAQTITVADISGSPSTQSPSITVNPGPATTFSTPQNSTASLKIGQNTLGLYGLLRDAYSNSISGTTVTLTATTTNGASLSVTSASTPTTSYGEALFSVSANATAGGPYTVTLATAGFSPLVYTITNTQDSTTTVVAPAPVTSSAYGQPVTLTATVTPTSTYSGSGPLVVRTNANAVHAQSAANYGPLVTIGPPTGTVSFYDSNARLLNTATLGGSTTTSPNAAQPLVPSQQNGTAATASVQVTVPVVGAHSYYAVYGADANFTTSTAVTVPYTVNQATVTLAGPTSQPVMIGYGQTTSTSVPVTVTGQYAGTGIATPTGTVTYSVLNGSSATVVASTTAPVTGGAATLSIPTTGLPVANYTISMTYSGDTNYVGVTTPVTISMQIGQAQPVISWAQPNAITYGATLGSALNAVAMNGTATVTAASSNGYVYTAKLSGGSAVAVTGSTVLLPGSYTLGVTFTPSDTTDYKTATGSVTLTVNKATPGGVTIASSVNPVLTQNAVTFTSTVSSTLTTPTGSVTFLEGTTSLGSGTLSGGVATLTTSALAVGTQSITAVYSGDSNFTTLTSSPLSEVVDDFNLTISISGGSSVTSVTAQPGGTAVYTFSLSPVGASTFLSTVTLSASGLPTGATYVFSPATLAAGSGTQSVTLTVQLPQTTASVQPHGILGGTHGSTVARSTTQSTGRRLAPFALALLLLPFAGRMRRTGKRLGRTICLLLLLAGLGAAAGLTGCGYNSGFFGQQPQTYTVTVTGTSGALVHSTTVTLIVQ